MPLSIDQLTEKLVFQNQRHVSAKLELIKDKSTADKAAPIKVVLTQNRPT